MSLFTKIVDRVFAAGGALLFLQAPQFIQDYTKILSGHLSEINWEMELYRKLAANSGRTLQALVEKYRSLQDPDITFQGEFLSTLIEREQEFKSAFVALTHANPLTKPFLFIKHLHWDLVKETTALFRPGLPLTLEGAIWALFGLFAGYLLFRTLAGFARLFKKSSSKTLSL